MKVLIIPEDPTHDHFVIKPIVEKIFADLNRRANIEVLRDPHLSGVDEALDAEVIRSIIADNPMVDLFLLVVDRDCNRLGNVTKAAAREADHPNKLITCLAAQEVEVWVLGLHRNEISQNFRQVREDCDPKERYFAPWIRQKQWSVLVGQGRKQAMRALPGNWSSLRAACPELNELRERIERYLQQH